MALGDTLSFGPFRFEPHTGRLTKRGFKIKLQPKAAAALGCLLEQPGEVVSRVQLQAKLWPEGTYVDFDLGIKVAIKKLRDALGDDSEESVYVQTVHGAGYRFIAPVESAVTAESNTASAKVAVQETPARLPIPIDRRTIWFGALVGVVALVIPAFLIPRAARSAPVNFQNRDWVVIAAFENRTGETRLDGTMEFALERALSQSRYVNVAPRDRINDALQLMRKSPTVVLTEDVARQVAVRDGGIKAVLAGRVEKFGPKYVLTVRLLEPARGETVAVFEREGAESQLPDAARSVSDELRRTLGEKADTISTSPPALERATTPSLAALRAFSAGMVRVNERNGSQAAPLLEEAIVEDPQFASAHIYAAHCYSNLNQTEKAAPHYEAAFRLAPDVSQRERLFILGSYYQRFLHDDRRAMDAYQALVNLYPADYWGVNNLMQVHIRLGMEPQRIEGLIRLAAIRPNNPNLNHLEALWDYYRFDRPDKIKARQFGDRLRRLRSSGSVPLRETPLDARLEMEVWADRWFSGDVKGAAQEVTRLSTSAQTHADGPYKRAFVGAILALGKLGEAKALCDTVVEPIVRTECLLRVADAGGNRELGRELLSKLRRSGPSPGYESSDVSVFARFGETAIPGKFFENDIEPQAKGWLLLAAGRLVEAAKLLQEQPATLAFTANRLPLAIALERLGKREEAIAKLEEGASPRARYGFNSYWMAERAKLAELYRKVGRIDDAVKVENQLRHYLSEADADFPILMQLRAADTTARKNPRVN